MLKVIFPSFLFMGLLVSLATPLWSKANVAELGMGSQHAATGTGVAEAEVFSPFWTFLNPAALSNQSDKRFSLTWGVLYHQPSFHSIDQIVLENSTNSDQSGSSTVQGAAATDYLATSGQIIGLATRIAPSWWQWSAGLLVYFPLERAAYLDSGETFVPEYALYRSRTQRPQIEFGLSFRPLKSFSFGLGFHTAFSLTTKVSSFIATSSNKSSSMRVSSSLKPKIAPYFGLLYQAGSISIGSVLRLPLAAKNTVVSDAKGEVFSGGGSPDVGFSAESTLFYEPLSVELGGSWRHHPQMKLMIQVDYQAWSRYQTAVLNLKGSSSGIRIADSALPGVEYRDVWIPRISEQVRFGRTIARLGYAFRPGILKNGQSGSANVLDPSKHQIHGGVGWEFSQLWGLEIPWTLDLHLYYHRLLTEKIQKPDPTSIGAPEYLAGGSVFGGGLTIGLMF